MVLTRISRVLTGSGIWYGDDSQWPGGSVLLYSFIVCHIEYRTESAANSRMGGNGLLYGRIDQPGNLRNCYYVVCQE